MWPFAIASGALLLLLAIPTLSKTRTRVEGDKATQLPQGYDPGGRPRDPEAGARAPDGRLLSVAADIALSLRAREAPELAAIGLRFPDTPDGLRANVVAHIKTANRRIRGRSRAGHRVPPTPEDWRLGTVSEAWLDTATFADIVELGRNTEQFRTVMGAHARAFHSRVTEVLSTLGAAYWGDVRIATAAALAGKSAYNRERDPTGLCFVAVPPSPVLPYKEDAVPICGDVYRGNITEGAWCSLNSADLPLDTPGGWASARHEWATIRRGLVRYGARIA